MPDPEWLRKAIADGSAVVKGVDPSAFGPVLDRALEGGVTELFRHRIHEKISEKVFQDCVIEFAQALGWLVAHFRTVRIQRADGEVYYETPVQADGAGFLDLELVRERLVKVELKREGGKLTKTQPKWLNAYEKAGVEHYIWYPRHAEEIIEVLTRYAPCVSPSNSLP